MIQIDMEVASSAPGLPSETDVQRWVSAAVGDRRANAEVSLMVVDEDQGQQLNRDYRGRDYPTNVLSFPADLPPELGLPLLGDLVVCAPVVAREAAEQDKALDAHWAHMLVHGTLHLLGYDHEQDDDADIMEALETEILIALGFPAPYADRE